MLHLEKKILKMTPLVLCLSLAMSGCQSSGEEGAFTKKKVPKRRPNVLIYLIDTLRADHLGCYGHTEKTTPNIDRLARDGVVFERTYAQAPWTKASTASIFTSNYPTTHGASTKMDGVISPDCVTIAEVLKENGYYTGGFIANAWVDPEFGFGQGFDEYHKMKDLVEGVDAGGKRSLRAEHINGVVFPWLEKHKDEPFFLYIHSVDPHDPYAPAHPFDDFNPKYEGIITGSTGQLRSFETQKPKLSEGDLAQLEGLYDGEIRYNDHHIGRLMEKLESLGILDDTIVIITSDHGEEFADHGSYLHGKNLYESMIRIPFVMRCPGWLPKNMRIGAMVQSIDIMPTVLEILDIDIPTEAQGKSTVPLLEGKTNRIHDFVFSERTDGSSKNPEYYILTAISERLKLITYPSGRNRRYNRHGFTKELFNLESDPGEREDLAKQEVDFVKVAQGKLDKWLEWQDESKMSQPVEPPVIDEETIRELKALGYIH